MKRNLLTLIALFGAFFSVAAGAVRACGYGARPNPVIIFARADAVLVGKIVWIEDRMESMKLHPTNPRLTPMRIAVVEVRERMKGTDQLTHLRVAFHQHTNIARGDDAFFTLTQHGSEPLHVLSTMQSLSSIDGSAAKRVLADLEAYRKLARLWRKPIESLSCGKLEDRMQATALFLYHAKTANVWDMHHSATKKATSSLTPEISRYILTNLAEANWQNVNFRNAQVSAGTLFHMLGASVREGWDPMAKENQKRGVEAAKDWCKSNARTFQIAAIPRTE